MIVKKIDPRYSKQNIAQSNKPLNAPKHNKKLCLLAAPSKRKAGESEEDWAKRFLEKLSSLS